MKIHLECYPCFIRFAVELLNKVGSKEIKPLLEEIKEIGFDQSPAVGGTTVWNYVTRNLKDKDLFKEEKAVANRTAKKMIESIDANKLSFNDIVKLAVIGNSFDVVARSTTQDIESELYGLSEVKLYIDDSKTFERICLLYTSPSPRD